MNSSTNSMQQVVTFGGMVFPESGWACILAGDPLPCKERAFMRSVPIQGHWYSEKKHAVTSIRIHTGYSYDNCGYFFTYEGPGYRRFEKKYAKAIVSRQLTDAIWGGNHRGVRYRVDLLEADIFPPFNTANARYMELLHSLIGPLSKSFRSHVGSGDKKDSDSLPNIILDCGFSSSDDCMTYIPVLSGLGYRVAIIWVLPDADALVQENNERGSEVYRSPDGGIIGYGRMTDRDELLVTHSGVLDNFRKQLDDMLEKETKPRDYGRNPFGELGILDDAEEIWAILSPDKDDPEVICLRSGNGENPDSNVIPKNALNRVSEFLYSDAERTSGLLWEPYGEEPNEGIRTGAIELYGSMNSLIDTSQPAVSKFIRETN